MPFLKLERPLVTFDIEATGVSTQVDRIIDICLITQHPDGSRTTKNFRVNPGMLIPVESSEIHGIYDADVADCPLFEDVASDILDCVVDVDLCGYNLLRFDIPMLDTEFTRAGLTWDASACKVVDVQRIFHRREPRDLSAALNFYCNELHLDAHGAQPDVEATIRVLEGQFEKYQDLPTTVAELDAYCSPRDPKWVDKTGRLKWAGGKVVLNFGKKRGVALETVLKNDASFANWMLRSDFPKDVKAILTDAMEGNWPTPPSADDKDSGNTKPSA